MNVISDEFQAIKNDIQLDKTTEDLTSLFRRKTPFVIKSVVFQNRQILINGVYLISSKLVSRLQRMYGVKAKELPGLVKNLTFFSQKVKSLTIVWVELKQGGMAFLKTRYDLKAISKWFHENTNYELFLCDLVLSELHADLAALSCVTAPFGGKDLETFDKSYIIQKHLKSLIEFYQISNLGSEFVLFGKDTVTFNSKLLSRDLQPIIVKAHLTPTGAMKGVSIETECNLKPFYLEPIIDYFDLSDKRVIIDDTAVKHLRSFKFREMLGVDNVEFIQQIQDEALNILTKAVYVKGLVVPLIYRGRASLGLRITRPGWSKIYCVGDYPTGEEYRIRTLMSPEVVSLNNRTITSLYSADEVII